MTIQFKVSGSATNNRPPNPPTLIGPGDWSVFEGPSGINFQAQANGDPDGDAITQYYFDFTVKDPTPRVDSFRWQWSDPRSTTAIRG